MWTFLFLACADLSAQEAATEPIPQKLDKITILFNYEPSVRFAGFLAAQENGFFQAEGLPPVEFCCLDERHDMLSEIRDGHAQFATVWTPYAYHAACADGDVVVISQALQHSALGIMYRIDRFPNLKKFEDFKELKIGSYFRASENIAMIGHHFGFPSEPVFYIRNGLILLRYGALDALYYNAYDAKIIVENSKYRDRCAFLPLIDSGIDLPEDSMICLRGFLEAQPEICAKFVRALFRGWLFVKNNREQALPIIKKYYDHSGVMYDDFLVDAQLDEWEKYSCITEDIEKNGRLSSERFDQMRQMMINAGLVDAEKAPAYEDFFVPVMLPETITRLRRLRETP